MLCLIQWTYASDTPPTNISGIINRYGAVTGVNVLQKTLTLSENGASGFTPGTQALLVQMKDGPGQTGFARTYEFVKITEKNGTLLK